MKKNNYFIAFVLLFSVVLLSACGGPQTGRVGDGRVVYEDAQTVETVNMDWGSTDLQTTVETMTQSLLDSPYITRSAAKPKIRLRRVVNQTSEHIDTKAITDKIRIKLLQSGQVRFLTDKSNLDEVYEERDFTESATRKPEVKLMTETDYIITGTVRSIEKRSKNIKDIYYLITLELVDPQSGEIVWADEKEIRKTKEKSFWGW